MARGSLLEVDACCLLDLESFLWSEEDDLDADDFWGRVDASDRLG